MDPSATITTLLDRKVYYFLMPLLPGGLLVMCILAGRPDLRTLLFYSEGFGYIFRISMLAAASWILGGVIFLLSLVMAAVASAMIENWTKSREATPWTISLWQRVVVHTFGAEIIIGNDVAQWRQIYQALEKAFPDEDQEQGEMLATLLLSVGLAFPLGTIWWRTARSPLFYALSALVIILAMFFLFVYSQKEGEGLAVRQVGCLLRKKLELDQKQPDKNPNQ